MPYEQHLIVHFKWYKCFNHHTTCGVSTIWMTEFKLAECYMRKSECRRNIYKIDSNDFFFIRMTSMKWLQIHLIRIYMLPVYIYQLIIIKRKLFLSLTHSLSFAKNYAEYQTNRKSCKFIVNATKKYFWWNISCIKTESDGIFQTQSPLSWNVSEYCE